MSNQIIPTGGNHTELVAGVLAQSQELAGFSDWERKCLIAEVMWSILDGVMATPKFTANPLGRVNIALSVIRRGDWCTPRDRGWPGHEAALARYGLAEVEVFASECASGVPEPSRAYSARSRELKLNSSGDKSPVNSIRGRDLADEEMAAQARPGESWEALRRRLRQIGGAERGAYASRPHHVLGCLKTAAGSADVFENQGRAGGAEPIDRDADK